MRPHKLFGRRALLIVGGNFHDNQINVGLSRLFGHGAGALGTKAQAHVINTAGYMEQGVDLLKGRLYLAGGLRYDYFGFDARVGNGFYRGTYPRVYLDGAPHAVSNAALTLSGWRSVSASLHFRYISSYRLDGANPAIRASGLSVLDLSMTKKIGRSVDFHLSVDNLTDKVYYETQNYFESRLRPGDSVVARIHGTPGYPIGFAVGLTFHLFGKER